MEFKNQMSEYKYLNNLKAEQIKAGRIRAIFWIIVIGLAIWLGIKLIITNDNLEYQNKNSDLAQKVDSNKESIN
ncbi:MAG: hypothetical protein COU29_03125 [Candidatus Magasanikbacteria bacterium CG10_big_fil_rev_8_21_14_0_10_36_32]|uniref:Uncharacterized protein n=1 Tax=Candidatus Magasanikbacteria bacterium CG10_big_fil_rev_8_21_14_0_10_36_32 TaxID=1974646 RepID=A0A2M6W605_9BACT|nr:MAG: hypothetical protein COU29_03125 [Candidatus Magasanikbacteria bacterium CG10_big_fil_rev_8_21_14_0_10_36_32]